MELRSGEESKRRVAWSVQSRQQTEQTAGRAHSRQSSAGRAHSRACSAGRTAQAEQQQSEERCAMSCNRLSTAMPTLPRAHDAIRSCVRTYVLSRRRYVGQCCSAGLLCSAGSHQSAHCSRARSHPCHRSGGESALASPAGTRESRAAGIRAARPTIHW